VRFDIIYHVTPFHTKPHWNFAENAIPTIVYFLLAVWLVAASWKSNPKASLFQLMAEAGFPDGFEVTLSYNAAQRESEEVAVLVKSSWEQVGVSVELQALPTAVWAEQKYGKKLQAFAENEQWPWSGDPGYSSWVYLGNGPDNFINGVNYNNPEYNALLEQAMRMLDSPEREAVTEQLQEIVAEDVPWSQIAWFDWTVAAKKDLTGFLWTPDNQIRFAYIRRQ
jgi:peptide/nickel transport system substrate-binding protein